METSMAKNPLNLVQWTMQNLEQKGRLSVLPGNSRYSVDPRISHERANQLKSAFDEIDQDKSGYLSLDEILSFLKQMNDEVDDEYVKGIFESMDRNRDGRVSINEFMDGYLQQVNGLSEAAARLKQSINEKKLELAFYNEQLEEARKTEVLNPFDIMEGSQLTVHVVEAQNLPGNREKPNSFVKIQCEKQKITTQVAPNTRNPVWNETFSFKIAMGNGEALVQAFNQLADGKSEHLGSASISLQDFRDQQKHERWLNLTGKAENSRVLVRVQWIHRRTIYLEGIINDLERERMIDAAEMSRIEFELRKLGTNPYGMFIKETFAQMLEKKVIDEVKSFTDKHLKTVGSFRYAQRVMVFFMILLAIFMNFERTDFCNLTWIGFVLIKEVYGYKTNEWRLAALGLALIFLVDLAWVIDDIELLIFEMHNDPRVNVERFSFICGFFNFLLKVLLFPVVVKNYIDAKAEEFA